MKRILLVITVFLVWGLGCVFAVDFGAVLSGQFDAENGIKQSDPNAAVLSGEVSLAPWFSLPLGEADFYVSLGMSADFRDNTVFIPELYRLEFSDRPVDSLTVRFGRLGWQDPSRFTARGRFDGLDIAYSQGKVKIGAAALYTGFLYKENADININPWMPPPNKKNYTNEFDWADFANTYAAPPRLLASLYGEFPGLPRDRGHLYAGFLAQFDFTDAGERYHTQYFLLRHTLSYKLLDLNIAGAVQLENTQAKGFAAAYAVSLEAGLLLPGALKNRLSLGMNWASGEGPDTAAYFPIIREAQGLVLQPHLSGMMVFRANYEVRFHPSLSTDIGGRYFIRTDSTSFIDTALKNDSYLIGAELYAGLLWIPLSDISLFLTGGIFIPQTGLAMPGDTPVRWSLCAGTTFSF